MTLTKRVTLIDDGVISEILSQEHSGFSVWWEDPLFATEGSLPTVFPRYMRLH